MPGLMSNLISVGQLDDEGHNVVSNNRSWKVTKGAIVVPRGKKLKHFMSIPVVGAR